MFQKRSLWFSTITLVLVTVAVLVLISGPTKVEAGKKEKLLLGLAVGHALQSRSRDHSLLRILIPLRLVTEAWKQYGKAAAHHDYDQHHYHGDYHHGYHPHHHHLLGHSLAFGHFEHEHDHFKA